MKVIKFKNKESFSSDFYIVNSEKGTVIIDAGFYNEEIKKTLNDIGNVDAILLTHGHFDHIQALDEIKKDFPDAKVYIHKNDYDFLRKPEFNLSLKHSIPFSVSSEANMLDEGSFKVGNYNIKLIYTPGHTGGSCLYYFEDEKILFTGDTIGEMVIGNSYYPSGKEEDMFNSLNKFKQLNLPTQVICYSSHWGEATYEEILKNNPYLKAF